MKLGLLILLAACVLASANIPRHRRAVNDDILTSMSRSTNSENNKTTEILLCAPQTPCAWSIYKPSNKQVELNITNNYCICGVGTVCEYNEDDTTASAYVYRCRTPVAEEHTPES